MKSIIVLVALVLSSGLASAADCNSVAAAGVDWRDCQKRLLMLDGSDFSGANLAETDFTATDLRRSNFESANLEGATLVRSSLAGSNARNANFSKVEGYRTDFSGIDGQHVNFINAELQRADFTGANLASTSFEKAELGRAQFENAELTGSRFTLANLARADFRKAKFTGPLDFSRAFFYLTRIAGVNLEAATGLEQWQIDMSCGDADTVLPAGLTAPADWPCQLD
ncbi:MAG: pentapeptide repeat-containing protein [Pseudaminobacter sp.]|nr:pentapeptide repeat-containing protein [Pseudaminobacter sp.]